MCAYAHILHDIETLDEQTKQKAGTAVNAVREGNLSVGKCAIG